MGKASGKFVLRVSPDLHSRLQRNARENQTSLNSICNQLLIKGLEGSTPHRSVYDQLVESLKSEWPEDFLGLMLFGSRARRDHSQNSDVDLLVVFRPGFKINRDLYKKWDQLVGAYPLELSPQFVAIRKSADEVGGLWFEVALEGKILWEKKGQLSLFLQDLRSLIAAGKVQRSFSHGHPYWKRMEGE